jgi:hypothetical protein
MGDFARVALPVAVAVIAPFALGTASLATVPITGGSIGAGTAGTTFIQGMSPWMIAANAGLTGLSQLGGIRQQRQQQQIAQAQSAAQARELQRRQAAEERKRRERLKANVATQRARFGASGLSSRGGSGAAVIAGLTQRTDQQSADAARDFEFQRTNLLEASRPARRDGFKLFQKTISPLVNLFD